MVHAPQLFRYYPRIIGYTHTHLSPYISGVTHQVQLYNERKKLNHYRYTHLDVHSRINQIYKNMNKKKY